MNGGILGEFLPGTVGVPLGALEDALVAQVYLRRSRTICDFSNRIDSLLRVIGIDTWSHTNANIPIDVLDVFGSWPEDLIEEFAGSEYYRDDLIIRHAMVSDKPIFTRHVYDYIGSAPFGFELSTRNLQIDQLLRKYGITNSFAVPVGRKRLRALFIVSKRNSNETEFEMAISRHREWLLSLAKLVDEIGRDQFAEKFHGEKFNTFVPILAKHLQLLTVLAKKDLTLNEAAEVLSISISTANQYIAAAKTSLNATTTHGAIFAAVSKGYIDLS
jgi:hypothetical protein